MDESKNSCDDLEKEYLQHRNSINNSYLVDGLNRFKNRLEEVASNPKIQEGLSTASAVREICQKVLFEEGLQYIWLVPIETSIDEYTTENFVAFNPYNQKSYSLVQSPQIQKEAAAIVLGSNFRIVDCFRGEKTDYSHSNIFQQLDVETANLSESEIRRIAGRLVVECYEQLKGIKLVIEDVYDYSELVDMYGTDSPNLASGVYIVKYNNCLGLKFDTKQREIVDRLVSCYTPILKKENCVIFNQNFPIEKLRKIRNEITDLILKDSNKLYAYWVVNMPYAKIKDGKLSTVHHVMSRPQNMEDTNFSFLSLSDSELCSLKCNSFDLIVCGQNGAIEVIGGDERINTFLHQFEAIKRTGLSTEQYSYLLEALHFNDMHEQKRLGGFAVGLERLAMMISMAKGISSVQLFPTNLPNGLLTHAISIEEMRRDDK